MRKLTKQWSPILKAKRKTRIGPELHLCPLCDQKVYTGKRSIEVIQIDHPDAILGKMDVDHRMPIIPIEESGQAKDWNSIISRMFCEEDNLQSICSTCHKAKSAAERGDRAKVRRDNKK